MKIEVEIQETYKNSCHYRLVIKLPGMGANHPGYALLDLDSFDENGVTDFITQGDLPTFRPEYAKAIQKALDGVEVK